MQMYLFFNPFSSSREDNFQRGYPCGSYEAPASINPGDHPKMKKPERYPWVLASFVVLLEIPTAVSAQKSKILKEYERVSSYDGR